MAFLGVLRGLSGRPYNRTAVAPSDPIASGIELGESTPPTLSETPYVKEQANRIDTNPPIKSSTVISKRRGIRVRKRRIILLRCGCDFSEVEFDVGKIVGGGRYPRKCATSGGSRAKRLAGREGGETGGLGETGVGTACDRMRGARDPGAEMERPSRDSERSRSILREFWPETTRTVNFKFRVQFLSLSRSKYGRQDQRAHRFSRSLQPKQSVPRKLIPFPRAILRSNSAVFALD